MLTDGSTDEQQTPNRQVTANKNVKNDKNEKKSNCRKPVYDETSIYFQLALTHAEEIQMNHPERAEPNLQKWAKDFRLIVERDKRTIEQIRHLMKWAGDHSFWHSVILSPTSIRRNWDKMVSQLKQEHSEGKKQGHNVQKK